MLSLRQLFDFVTDPNITDDNIDLYLDKVCLGCMLECVQIASRARLLCSMWSSTCAGYSTGQNTKARSYLSHLHASALLSPVFPFDFLPSILLLSSRTYIVNNEYKPSRLVACFLYSAL